MKLKVTIPILIILAGLLISCPVSAQTTDASTGFTPYSIFGFGDLARQGTVYNLSMGGIGVGDRNVRFINLLNPAAVTARESKSFMMDFGLESRNVYYAAHSQDGLTTSANNTFNMHHIVMSFPIAKHSAFMIGVQPYSSVGYKFRSMETDDVLLSEAGDITYTKQGEGGLSQAFLAAGVTLFGRLHLGAEGQYYFGNIMHYSAAAFNTSSAYRSINSGWDYFLTGFTGKLGLQYEQPLGHIKAVVGATWTLPTQIGGHVDRFAYGVNASATDTIVNRTEPGISYNIPSQWSAGLTLKDGDHWMVGFDYQQQDWSGTDFGSKGGVDFAPCKMQAYRLGFEWTPDRYDIRYYHRHITYRGGVYHEKTYYTFNGHQVEAYGLTFGVSLPVFRYYNSINIGVDLGQRGTVSDGLIRERYALIYASFSLHDIWFLKNLYE